MKRFSFVAVTLGVLATTTAFSQAPADSELARAVRGVITDFPLFGRSDVGSGDGRVPDPLKVRYRVADARTLLPLHFSRPWRAEMEGYWEITPFAGPPRTAEQMQARFDLECQQDPWGRGQLVGAFGPYSREGVSNGIGEGVDVTGQAPTTGSGMVFIVTPCADIFVRVRFDVYRPAAPPPAAPAPPPLLVPNTPPPPRPAPAGGAPAGDPSDQDLLSTCRDLGRKFAKDIAKALDKAARSTCRGGVMPQPPRPPHPQSPADPNRPGQLLTPTPELRAWLTCGDSLSVAAGEPGKAVGVCVTGWANSADPVTVVFPQLTDTRWGYLPNGIVVFPGNVGREPSQLSRSAAGDHSIGVFPTFWSAKPDAPARMTEIDVIVNQKKSAAGGGTVQLKLKLTVLPRPAHAARAAGGSPVRTFAGQWETTVGPMVLHVEGNRLRGAYPRDNAVLEGEVRGTEFLGTWRDHTGGGKLRMVLAPDGPRFAATWVRTDGRGGNLGSWSGDSIEPGNPPVGPLAQEPAGVSKRTLQAAKRRLRQGGTVLVPVYLIGGKDVVNNNWSLTYDPRVLRPEGDVVKGNLLNQAMFRAWTKENAIIRGTFFQKTGLQEGRSGTVGVIKFRAVGPRGSKSPLRLTVTKANGRDGKAMPVDVIDGAVYVVGPNGEVPGSGSGLGPTLPPPGAGRGPGGTGGGRGPGGAGPGGRPGGPGAGGGAGGTGPAQGPRGTQPGGSGLTALDVMLALKMGVHEIPTNRNLDLDRDGVVDSNDARLIAERVAR